MRQHKSQFEVWAQLKLTKRSVEDIHSFFREDYGISPVSLIYNLHLTIYHSRRPMFNVEEVEKSINLSIDTYDTRMMVMAPGGENPNPKYIPARHKVGIRIKKDSPLRAKINDFRNQLIQHETRTVLGKRRASTARRNAFGARHFQPHISLLKPGSGIITDLAEVGENFRESIPEIHFDKFIVHKKRNF